MEQILDSKINVSEETCRNIYKALLSAQEYLKKLDAEKAKAEKRA